MKKILYILLGLMAILFGVIILIWVIWNTFIERLPTYNQAGAPLLATFILPIAFIVVGGYWIKKAFIKEE